jgi:hypothetical protein
MAEAIWEKGTLRAVLQPVGRRENGEMRYRRALFDVLEWASVEGQPRETYILPRGIVAVTGTDVNALNEADEIGREFGYYDAQPLIIEPHEGDGKSDSWRALHAFGYC